MIFRMVHINVIGSSFQIRFTTEFRKYYSFYYSFSLFNTIMFCQVLSSVHVCYVTSTVSNSLQRYGPQPTSLLCPWDSPGINRLPHPPAWGLLDSEIKPTSPHISCIVRWVLYHQCHLESPLKSVLGIKWSCFLSAITERLVRI